MDMVTVSEADQKLKKVLLRDKETLGRLIRHFAERTTLPENFSEIFDSLLEQRNLFVHNLFMAPWFDLKTPKGCARLQEYMRNIRSATRVALHVMIATAQERPANFQASEVKERIDLIVDRIEKVVEPYFGDLTEEQYVARAVKNSVDTYGTKPR
jgi:hypothetical protein